MYRPDKMIEIKVEKNENGVITGFGIGGHARIGKLPGILQYLARYITAGSKAGLPEVGYDIICASVSSIAQSAVIGLQEVAGIAPHLEVKPGYLYCRLPESLTEEQRTAADIILKTMVLSLESIRLQYKQYIRWRC